MACEAGSACAGLWVIGLAEWIDGDAFGLICGIVIVVGAVETGLIIFSCKTVLVTFDLYNDLVSLANKGLWVESIIGIASYTSIQGIVIG